MVLIKNYIEYFYNLNNLNITKIDKIYKFVNNNLEYLFLPLTRFNFEIVQINNLIKNNDSYDQIIPNIYKELVTTINNMNYILVLKRKKVNILNTILNEKAVILPYIAIDKIDRTNWEGLWAEKIDYIEYQMKHIEEKYKIISSSIWYYVGMGENAISYINETNSVVQKDNYVISHKRIIENDFNNPLNIIIDYKSRDISEYLKYIFINNKYDYLEIEKYLNSLNLNEYLLRTLYGRMFFVSFYFDMYEKIVNGIESEDKIKKIILRNSEYEDYLNNIYIILNKIHNIPEISWIH